MQHHRKNETQQQTRTDFPHELFAKTNNWLHYKSYIFLQVSAPFHFRLQPAVVVGLCRWMLLFGSGCCYFRVSFSVRVRVCCLHTYTNTHLHISSKTEIAVLRRVPHTCSPEGQISVLSPVCRSFLPSERTDDDSIRSVCIVTFFFSGCFLYIESGCRKFV